MKFALILNNTIKEYREYPSQPDCKVIDGLPVIRPVVEQSRPEYDADLYTLVEQVEITDTQVNKTWQLVPIDLETAKVRTKARINAARDTEEAGTFSYLGKTFDADAQAIKRLYGAAMAAQAAISQGATPTNKFVDWTLSDGTTQELTYAQAAALPLVMAQTANALHVKARQLKTQIDSATTVEEIGAIKW